MTQPERPCPSRSARARRRGAATVALWALLLGVSIASAGVGSESSWAASCGALPSPQETLRRVNAARAAGAMCHRSSGAVMFAAPLRWNVSLADVATTQARQMALLDRMQHRDARDRGLAERLRATGYRFSTAAENIAVGYASMDTVVDAWIDSEKHCTNLMDPAVSEVGLACADGAATAGGPVEARYWTLVLGAQRRGR